MSILCLSNASAVTVEDLRSSTDAYVKSIRNLRAESQVVRVSRLSSGKLCEKTFSVECVMRDYTMRHAYFVKAAVDGKESWFDIRETVVFPSGNIAEWRHPTFPGHFAFGESAIQVSLMQTKACEIGDPLYVLKRIRRAIGRDGAHVDREADGAVIAQVPLKSGDYLEFEFSSEFDWLPTRMTRICVDENDEKAFRSGGFFSVDYVRQQSGEIVPAKATYITNLKDHAAGTLSTTWDYSAFDVSAEPTQDEMALKLPVRIMSVDLDTDEKRMVTSQTDDVAADLKKRFGAFVQIQDRVTAKKGVSTSFVGRCPDLPDTYHKLTRAPLESIQESSASWRTGLLVLHAVGVLGITLYCRRRKTGPRNSP